MRVNFSAVRLVVGVKRMGLVRMEGGEVVCLKVFFGDPLVSLSFGMAPIPGGV